MDIYGSVEAFTTGLNKAQISFAIIGGLALFAYGGERATFDVDFLIHGQHREKVKSIASALDLKIAYETAEVLQLSGTSQIDVLFANRPLSQKMLSNLRKIGTLPYPVVTAEDLIGLKIQAFTNDRSREIIDKGDILTLFRLLPELDFDKIKEYADIFNVWTEIENIRQHK